MIRRDFIGGLLAAIGLGPSRSAVAGLTSDRWYRLVLRTIAGDTVLYTWQRPVPMAEVMAFRDEIRDSLAWQRVSGPDAVVIIEEAPPPKWRAISRERLGDSNREKVI